MQLIRWQKPVQSKVKVGWQDNHTVIKLPRYTSSGAGSYMVRIEKVVSIQTWGDGTYICCDAFSINYGYPEATIQNFSVTTCVDVFSPILIVFEESGLKNIDAGFLPSGFSTYNAGFGKKRYINGHPVLAEDVLCEILKSHLL